MLTGHTLSSIWSLNQAVPMLFIAIPIITIIVALRFFYPLLQKQGFTISK